MEDSSVIDETRLTARLAELTGLLSPAEHTQPGVLDQARRLIAQALVHGQTEAIADLSRSSFLPSVIDSLEQETVAELRRIVHGAVSAPRDGTLRVFRRAWPLLATHVPESVPAWASGWPPESSIGPLESEDRGLVWFDIRRTSRSAHVVDAETERPIISLPQAMLSDIPVNAGVGFFNIPAGSVWLAASLFDSNAPAGSFAGLRIRGGTLRLSEAAVVQGDMIRANGGVVATLQLTLDPPAHPAHPGDGGDARDVRVDFPDQVTFALSIGASGKLIEITRARLEVYENRVGLRNLEGAAPRYESGLARLWFPMSADRESLSIDDARSQLLRPFGEAPIREAAWTLPVAIPTGGHPINLGAAAGVGALALSLGKGLRVTAAPGEPSKPFPLHSSFLLIEPGHLSMIAKSAPARYARVLDLWERKPGIRCAMEIHSDEPLLLRFDATAAGAGAEVLSLSKLGVEVRLDRPVTAAGRPVAFVSRRATLDVQRHAGVTRIVLAAPTDPPYSPVTGEPMAQPGLSFALSNAFIRTSAASALQMLGVLNGEDKIDEGILTLRFALGFLLPSLPDPYAANMGRQAPRGDFDRVTSDRSLGLVGRVRWSTPGNAEVTFALGAGGEPAFSPSFLRISDAPIDRETEGGEYLREIEARFARATGQGPELFRLLDVSSRADLFGVGYSSRLPGIVSIAGTPLHFRGLELIAPVHDVSAFTLPAFQWEPVYDIPAPGAGYFPPKLTSATDGGPSRFAMPAANLVPVAPIPVVDTFLTEYNRQYDLALAARFTLPFGMVAVAELRRRTFSSHFPIFSSPGFESIRPRFQAAGLSGALQLVLRAPSRLLITAGGPSPGLPGATVQTNNGTSAYNVLRSGLVDATFNDTFADKMKMVPLERIDFTGYGASTFSDWRHPDVQGAGVTQVKFEAIVGRTAREVVQVRAKVYPWCAIFVRIITMERSGSAGVFRRDSGWQAASDGDYKLPGCVFHPGVVPRLTNIRRIRDTTNIYERDYPTAFGNVERVKLTQVLFDADIEIEGVTHGANASRLVPACDIIGYVQALPVGKDLTAEQLGDLLIATGPIGGPIDCELNVAQSGVHMRLARFEVDRTTTLAGNTQFVSVARGTVELPSAGEWTFAYRGPSEPEPHRLEVDRPIPLIRANPTGGVTAPYRFADAQELHRVTHPSSEYGLLFSAGAQRMLVPQPQLRWGEPIFHAGSGFLFADMYTLAGGVGLFPRPDLCHPLPTGSLLRVTGRKKMRLDIPLQPGLAPGEFKVGPLERTLSQTATMRMRSRFQPDSRIKLVIDSDQRPDWSCTFGPVTTLADIGDLEELTQVVGTMTSSSEAAPQLQNPSMAFGGALKPVQEIIGLLSGFGLPFGFDVSVTNAEYGFKSGWKYVFPKYPPGLKRALEDGLGVLPEIELYGRWGKESKSAEVIGKEISGHSLVSTKGIPKGPDKYNWHFIFECEAKMEVEAFNITKLIQLFLVGAMKFEIGGEEEGKTQMTGMVGFGGTADVEVPPVIKLTGSRIYYFALRHLIGTKQVSFGGASEWEVEGAFLDGLAAVKLSFELLALYQPGNSSKKFKGTGTVAIDVTLAWVLSKEFEVEIDVTEEMAATVFVAMVVLP